MKLTGTLRGGRHLVRNISKSSENNPSKTGRKQMVWWKKALTIFAITCGVLVVFTVGVYAYIKFAPEPPEVDSTRKPNDNNKVESEYTAPPVTPTGDLNQNDPVDTPVSNRKPDTYTGLILAMDQEGSNTDVIMVVNFDTANYTLNIANIPRDTMVNVKWNSNKRINSVLANMRIKYKGEDDDKDSKAMQGTVEAFADILGFKVDFWVTINMKAFVTLIDAINGVDYDIPSNMEYHDPEQNLHISYKKGMKKGITGQQALEILRFRSYASGDIARINNQQGFLKAAAEQILAKKDSINVIDLANIVFNNVKTGLGLNHTIWFGKELLKIDAENINFVTLPGNYLDTVGGNSYVTIYVDEWLEIVNTMLNPYLDEITADDVSILTRGADKKLYVTNGNRQGDASWGASSRGSGPSPSSSKSGSTSGSYGNSTKKPSSNPSSSSQNTSTSDPDVTSTDGTGALPDNDHVTTDSPSDEILPLDVDSGQTENPVEPPSAAEPPFDMSAASDAPLVNASVYTPPEPSDQT